MAPKKQSKSIDSVTEVVEQQVPDSESSVVVQENIVSESVSDELRADVVDANANVDVEQVPDVATETKSSKKRGGKKKDAREDVAVGEKEKKTRVVAGCVSMDLVRQMMKNNAFPHGEINQTKVKIICDMFIKTVIESVKAGENVTLTNYLTFKRAKRAERVHKIPKSEETVTKPAHYVMTIDVKPALKKEFETLQV